MDNYVNTIPYSYYSLLILRSSVPHASQSTEQTNMYYTSTFYLSLTNGHV